MGQKRFDSLDDFARHGVNLHLACTSGHCRHTAVLNAWQVVSWAKAWRWPTALEAGVMKHFCCSRCGARWPTPRPTMNEVTLTTFFPEDEQGWKRLKQRIRR